MKILEKASSRALVEFVLLSKKELEIEKSEISKLDFIATEKENPSKQYGVVVRYRNIPKTETRSQVFEYADLQEIKNICEEKKMVPVIAFALFDEDTEKTYAFLFTIAQMEELSKDEDEKEFFKQVMNGLQIKVGVGYKTSEELLEKLKKRVDYIEIQQNGNNFFS